MRNSATDDIVQLLRAICSQAGVRATRQRLEVLREIVEAKDHPTVESVFVRVRRRLPSISLDAVYRALALFERQGAVRKLQVIGQPLRYDGRRTPHHHLLCMRCGGIVDFEWPEFDRAALPPAASRWGCVQVKDAQVYGLCRKCLKGGRRLREIGREQKE